MSSGLLSGSGARARRHRSAGVRAQSQLRRETGRSGSPGGRDGSLDRPPRMWETSTPPSPSPHFFFFYFNCSALSSINTRRSPSTHPARAQKQTSGLSSPLYRHGVCPFRSASDLLPPANLAGTSGDSRLNLTGPFEKFRCAATQADPPAGRAIHFASGERLVSPGFASQHRRNRRRSGD